MAITHDIGRLFFHTIRVQRGTPLAFRAKTTEVDPPFRQSHPLVLRLPLLSRALVLGWWEDTDRDEDEALSHALAIEDEATADEFDLVFMDVDLPAYDPDYQTIENTVRRSRDVDLGEWTVVGHHDGPVGQ